MIISIELRNFLIHKHLYIKPHPKINVILGRNGDGKSAIVNAIAFLFESSRELNRHKDMSHFIHHSDEKATYCSVTINLVINESTFCVTRKYRRGVGSSWAILNQGKTVASTRGAFRKYVKEWGIDMLNPIVNLTQETSKTLFRQSKPRVLYEFFEKSLMYPIIMSKLQKSLESLKSADDFIHSKGELIEQIKPQVVLKEAALKQHEVLLQNSKMRDYLIDVRTWLNENLEKQIQIEKYELQVKNEAKLADLWSTSKADILRVQKELDSVCDEITQCISSMQKAKDAYHDIKLKQARLSSTDYDIADLREEKTVRDELKEVQKKLTELRDSEHKIRYDILKVKAQKFRHESRNAGQKVDIFSHFAAYMEAVDLQWSGPENDSVFLDFLAAYRCKSSHLALLFKFLAANPKAYGPVGLALRFPDHFQDFRNERLSSRVATLIALENMLPKTSLTSFIITDSAFKKFFYKELQAIGIKVPIILVSPGYDAPTKNFGPPSSLLSQIQIGNAIIRNVLNEFELLNQMFIAPNLSAAKAAMRKLEGCKRMIETETLQTVSAKRSPDGSVSLQVIRSPQDRTTPRFLTNVQLRTDCREDNATSPETDLEAMEASQHENLRQQRQFLADVSKLEGEIQAIMNLKSDTTITDVLEEKKSLYTTLTDERANHAALTERRATLQDDLDSLKTVIRQCDVKRELAKETRIRECPEPITQPKPTLPENVEIQDIDTVEKISKALKRLKTKGHVTAEVVKEKREKLEAIRCDLELAEEDLKVAQAAHAQLLLNHERRIQEYNKSLTTMSKRVNKYFSTVLSLGSGGELIFDHENRTIDVSLSLRDHQVNILTLSGGELSSVQMAYIQSICMGSSYPLYCFDEFDVFMDDVNRLKNTATLLDTAVATQKQFFVVTPHMEIKEMLDKWKNQIAIHDLSLMVKR